MFLICFPFTIPPTFSSETNKQKLLNNGDFQGFVLGARMRSWDRSVADQNTKRFPESPRVLEAQWNKQIQWLPPGATCLEDTNGSGGGCSATQARWYHKIFPVGWFSIRQASGTWRGPKNATGIYRSPSSFLAYSFLKPKFPFCASIQDDN